VEGGTEALLGEYASFLGQPEDTQCRLNPRVILNYQVFAPGKVCRTEHGLFSIQEIIQCQGKLHGLGKQLKFSHVHQSTLDAFVESDIVLFPLENPTTVYLSRDGDYFLLNYENK